MVRTSDFLFQSPVISNIKVGDQINRIRISNFKISNSSRSGQFINIRVTQSLKPFWRRPFSIHQVDREQGWFDILYETVGHGTRLLSKYQKNDILDIVGPVGSFFQIPDDVPRVILVAGGLGIAPMLFLSEELRIKNVHPKLLYGSRSRNTLVCLDDFKQLGIEPVIATDDGTEGYKGLVTELLVRYISDKKNNDIHFIYSCGPIPMLAKVQEIVRKYGLNGQISIETLMGCGIGVCNGCPVETFDSDKDNPRYLLSCKDGPVFDMNRIRLNG